MKKMFGLIIFIFLIFNVSALELTSEKNSFKQGENFLAVLNGNILQDIEESQIGFYKAHVEQPFDFGFKKIDGKYYIYSIMPFVSGDYSLKVKDIYFKENNKVSTEDRTLTFSVSNEIADFSVKPGALTAKDNFTLLFINNLNNDFLVSYKLEEFQSSTNLPLQSSKNVFIKPINVNSTKLRSLELSSESGFSYNLPIYFISSVIPIIPIINTTNITNNSITNTTNTSIIILVNGSENLVFSESKLEINISPSKSVINFISLGNFGSENYSNINIFVSDSLKKYVLVSEKSISLLESNNSKKINFTYEFPKPGIYEGDLVAESKNSFDILHLTFKVEKNKTFTTSQNIEKTCSELGYKICEVCYGSLIPASGETCCSGSCEKTVQPISRNYTAIIVVVILLLLIVGFLLFRYKKPSLTARDILKKKTQSFSKEFETKGSLGKS